MFPSLQSFTNLLKPEFRLFLQCRFAASRSATSERLGSRFSTAPISPPQSAKSDRFPARSALVTPHLSAAHVYLPTRVPYHVPGWMQDATSELLRYFNWTRRDTIFAIWNLNALMLFARIGFRKDEHDYVVVKANQLCGTILILNFWFILYWFWNLEFIRLVS